MANRCQPSCIYFRDFTSDVFGSVRVQLVCWTLWLGAIRRGAGLAHLAAIHLPVSARRLHHLAHPLQHVLPVYVRARVGVGVGPQSLLAILLPDWSRRGNHKRNRENISILGPAIR